MTKASVSRRQAAMDRVNAPDPNDGTRPEIPADARAAGKSIEQQIQEQIELHIAKKRPGTSS